MTKGALRRDALSFFLEPIEPYPLAAFRVLFALCVCATLLLLRADWYAWFGVHGWITPETIAKAESGFRINAFDLVPPSDKAVNWIFWLFLTAALLLAFGAWARVSSIAVFVGLNSLNQRMPLILHGGDTFLRCASFFLMFADSGAVWSVDAIRRRGPADPKVLGALISPWAQRLIQYQLACVYLGSFLWKAKGSAWWDGTALYYVFNLREVQRFPVPTFFRSPVMMHVEAWAALAFELAFPLLIWFRPLRTKLLIAGLFFHLMLEYAFNIPMFQWDLLSAYVLFLDSATILSAVRRIVSLIALANGRPLSTAVTTQRCF